MTSATPLKGFTWLYHRLYQPHQMGKLDKAQYFISHAGMADNPGIAPEEVEQARENLQHNKAQLEARLFGRFAAPVGLALKYDPTTHPEELTDEQASALVAMGRVFAGIDFGAWRFAFTLWAVDRDGVVHQIDEYFSQREELTTRASAITAMLKKYGCADNVRIWGDAANPTDIMELNAAFGRVHSPFNVIAVAMENKMRNASVDRLNDLLGRKALRLRTGCMAGKTWMLGYSAASSGKPVEGSRLAWEVLNWCYPEAGEGKAQKQDPDDHTADGADAIASMRYAIMSWWKAAKPEEDQPNTDPNYDDGFDKVVERKNKQRAALQKLIKKRLREAKKK